ncbi:MAG: ergothioneine biosynthesis protein EgtB, partial [Okeania sp. SIO2H7]|nr:ergothioneine biosynthesis protein EgtB [Okeania sp. SIO2H7]
MKLSKQQQMRRLMEKCRQGTLQMFADIDYNTLSAQPHPDFSPIGWHLGHIGYTEALWLLEKCAGMPPLFPEKRQFWAADGLSKEQRRQLPSLPEILEYLELVRSKVFFYLETAPIEEQERLWWFILQHESQHCETIALVLAMQELANNPQLPIASQKPGFSTTKPDLLSDSEALEIPAGEFSMGCDSVWGMDNERSLHRVYLETYFIEPYPVTCVQYYRFMEAGGYGDRRWWSPEGWEWLQANPVDRPLYWREDLARSQHPVCGVSWYEAEAYCNFVGKRLPTEAEWEKAASWEPATGTKRTYPWGETGPDNNKCNCDRAFIGTTAVGAFPDGASPYGCQELLGNVWEWTAS